MAVTSVTRLQRSGDLSLEERTHSLVYRAVTNSVSDTDISVIAAVVSSTGIDLGSGHPADAASRCDRISATDVERNVWEVTYSFKTLTPEEEEKADDPDPLTRDPSISYSFDFFERPIDFDKDGSAIVNSAGDPFDPPVTKDDFRFRVVYEDNVQTFNPATYAGFVNKTNDASFSLGGVSWSAGVLKVANISASSQRENNDGTTVEYFKRTIEFHADPNGWDAKVLDAGKRYLDSTSGTLKNILTQGQPVSDPVPLDGSGLELDSTSSPVELSFTIYDDADFSSL